MRRPFFFFQSFLLVSVVVSLEFDESTRTFSVIDYVTTFGRCKGCSRRCLEDQAVINGYCCGCARVSDYLPIDCPAVSAHCPHDGRRLCRNYDYMLDCCCP